MNHTKKYHSVKNPKALLLPATMLAIMATAGSAIADHGGQTQFITSAVEHANGTVTFPLYRGTSHGQHVYYVVLDTSDGNLSQFLGVNTAQKLANARNTAAVQRVTVNNGDFPNGVVDFPATVDFSPDRILTVVNGAFPPTEFQPGAVGEPGYSPLIQLPNGTIVNAPQIARDANGDGKIDLFTEAADKVVSIDLVNNKVTYLETNGFQGGNPVHYVSFESSSLLAVVGQNSIRRLVDQRVTRSALRMLGPLNVALRFP